MKKLIEDGYVYITTPPLYLLKKGSTIKYCFDEDEREQAIKDLTQERKR